MPTNHTSVVEDRTTLVASGEGSAESQTQTDSQADRAGLKAEALPASSSPIPDKDDADLSTRKMKPLPIVVDAMIGLLLLLVGGFIGEVLAEKSTGEVWREAGSAPKFPPMDLLLWLAPPIMLLLIYYLLVTRRKSLGAWLQKRSQS
jgi:hypothetical protein